MDFPIRVVTNHNIEPKWTDSVFASADGRENMRAFRGLNRIGRLFSAGKRPVGVPRKARIMYIVPSLLTSS